MTKQEEFFKSKSFAVVGATSKKEKFGYLVFKRLLNLGKPVYPIHPQEKEIEGVKVYKTLSELPEVPEAVDIIVPSSVTEKIVRECKELGIKKVWMQPGAESPDAIKFCEDNGISVVYHDCVLKHPNYD
ncbi:MAG TPA: CoA-binding protein [Spirochaetota bacterium]|nr:CoA-binding protein [Spirochaetota bacterium]HOM37574.1 CoA-binding protein [Spirochaetota bacterium]HPQ49455.1 CoA-binding protein [Spirochaetota bacterium]